jgi:hypothetical protein
VLGGTIFGYWSGVLRKNAIRPAWFLTSAGFSVAPHPFRRVAELERKFVLTAKARHPGAFCQGEGEGCVCQVVQIGDPDKGYSAL